MVQKKLTCLNYVYTGCECDASPPWLLGWDLIFVHWREDLRLRIFLPESMRKIYLIPSAIVVSVDLFSLESHCFHTPPVNKNNYSTLRRDPYANKITKKQLDNRARS